MFGGISHGADLANISAWAGESVEQSVSRQLGQEPVRADGLGVAVSAEPHAATGTVVSSIYRPALPVSQLQMMPPGYAWLFYRSDPPRQVETRPAGLIPQLAQLRGYHREA